MKLKSFTFITAVAFTAFLVLKTNTATSKIAQPPTGNLAGETAGATCTQCHSGTATVNATQFELRMDTTQAGLANASSIVTSATQFVPGTTYFMQLALTATTGAIYGFELIPTTGGAMAGTLTRTNTANTSTIASGSKTYLGHKSASSNKTWQFKWTAPATTTDVTFFYTGLVGNGNNSDNGDVTYRSSSVLTAYVAPNAVENIKATLTDVSVFPTATASKFNLAFNLPTTQNLSINIMDLSGRIVKTVLNEKVNAGDFNQILSAESLSAGTYLVVINGENVKATSKIIKL